MKEITPQAAYAFLQTHAEAVFIDVRTLEELERTGKPLGALHIPFADSSWRPLPGFAAAASAVLPQDVPLVFICRSGKRSRDAALLLESLGYADVRNVLEGVEGDANAAGQRGLINQAHGPISNKRF
jgi:rhodanese-related sulfurtransferase